MISILEMSGCKLSIVIRPGNRYPNLLPLQETMPSFEDGPGGVQSGCNYLRRCLEP